MVSLKTYLQNVNLHPRVREHALTIASIVGVCLGMGLGALIRFTEGHWAERDIIYMSYIGEIYIGMLKALILPLVISSLISAVGNLDLSLSGRIGSQAVLYYFCTTVLALVLGIILVTTIQPGSRFHDELDVSKNQMTTRNTTIMDTFMDLVR